MCIACVAGVRRGGKGERRAREGREDSRTHLTFLSPFLRPATQTNMCIVCFHNKTWSIFILFSL